MPEPKKTRGRPDTKHAESADNAGSHIRLKPRRIQPRTRAEFLQVLPMLSAEIQRELQAGIEAGELSEVEVIDRLIASRLELAKNLLSDEEREEIRIALRSCLQDIWRQTE